MVSKQEVFFFLLFFFFLVIIECKQNRLNSSFLFYFILFFFFFCTDEVGEETIQIKRGFIYYVMLSIYQTKYKAYLGGFLKSL